MTPTPVSNFSLGPTARPPEPQTVVPLLETARLDAAGAARVQALAMTLARGLRERMGAGVNGRSGLVQGLLQEFALSSQEGVALMCLAEALLRIPDAATRDALIRDKIGRADWRSHVGHSESLFVNAASWGLLLTGRLVATHSGRGLESALMRVLGRGGEPVIRKGLDMAMRLMGEQFVTGQTIHEALKRAREREAQGFLHSYDMLGEAAMTAEDAQRYFEAYAQAIEAIGQASGGRGVIEGPGISIKLSALHPRYQRAQLDRVHGELYPRLLQLALLARRANIGLNIDAEESERLEISLALLQRLCHEPALSGWDGVGFVVQAYQRRCAQVLDSLIDLAQRTGHRLMVRLVKGAYWDSEIKRAQVEGQQDYPVYTRKAHTDMSYLAAARRMLGAPEAIYPQFATHNAHTVAAIVEMADPSRWHRGQYEFQCLHGMGEPLYEQVVGGVACTAAGLAQKTARPCRIYAPVGTHETLLAYLVRRLLENGANTSFVNRVGRADVALESLIEDPVLTVMETARREGAVGLAHPAIPLPQDLHGAQRRNSAGVDLHCEAMARSLMGGQDRLPPEHLEPVPEATQAEVMRALEVAATDGLEWSRMPASQRAAVLNAAADRLEADLPQWVALMAKEAGKTVANGVAEVREAADFLRYDAQQLMLIQGLGETEPLGPVLCISPWNFPLAIFVGQVAAALAAGNPVLAKPAEQTPVVALRAVQALWAAGVPRAALQLLPGPGETVGAALVADARVQAVMFTGSTEVARAISACLARRLDARGQPVTVVAETGGQNAMIVDSSALPEQVTTDVLASAFDSAGQRCSALRVLCVQEDVADAVLQMILGAMAELRVGDAALWSTDVGPVIDTAAQRAILAHIEAMRAAGLRVHQPVGSPLDAPVRAPVDAPGTDSALSDSQPFVPPTLIELDGLQRLQREVFGPVLHVLRWKQGELPSLLEQIRRTGYGLTMGVHSRIDETIAEVLADSHAGNLYVNRNMVGAVVGVQPFGGEGLSGTGPKAGGPLSLLRLLARKPEGAARALVLASGVAAGDPTAGGPAAGGPTAGGLAAGAEDPTRTALAALIQWLQAQGQGSAARQAQRDADAAFSHQWRELSGPTGERNLYAALPRRRVLCRVEPGPNGLADSPAGLLRQTAGVLAVGSRALWVADDAARALRDRLPAAVAEAVDLVADWQSAQVDFDAVLFEGSDAALLDLQQAMSRRSGPLVTVTRLRADDAPVPLDRLVLERSVSVNTAAAGGNATLMTMG